MSIKTLTTITILTGLITILAGVGAALTDIPTAGKIVVLGAFIAIGGFCTRMAWEE